MLSLLLVVIISFVVFLHSVNSATIDQGCENLETSLLYVGTSHRINRCLCVKTLMSDNKHYDLHCQNVTGFPVLANETTRHLVSVLQIERSYLTMVDIHQYYPNVMAVNFQYNKVVMMNCTAPLANLTKLDTVRFYWTKFNITTFEHVLCSLPPQGVNVTLNGVFQGPTETNLENSTALKCLHSPDNNITHLDFSANDIDIASIREVMCNLGNKTKWVKLGKVFTSDYLRLNKSFFQCISNLELDFLELKSMRIQLPGRARPISDLFEYLANVKGLSFYHTTSSWTLEPFGNMSNLRSVNLGENAYREFNMFTKNESRMDYLEMLDLRKNSFPKLIPFNEGSFPNLRYLNLQENHGSIQTIPDRFVENLPNLEILNLDKTHLAYIHEMAFSSPSLKTLYLSEVIIDLMWVSSRIFLHARNISTIWMNHLNRAELKPEEVVTNNAFFQLAFMNMPTLHNVSLVSVGISQLSTSMFNCTPNIRFLDLADNTINTIESDALLHLHLLEYLVLNNNKLTTIDSSMVPVYGNTCLHLNVSFNPFRCDCALTDLKEWMDNTCHHGGRKPNVILGDNKEYYYCPMPSKQRVINYNPSDDCRKNDIPLAYKLAISVSTGLCIITMVISVVFRFRHHLYYLYIHVRTKSKKYRELEEIVNYQYDAFISYNRNDAWWVINVLRPLLEGKHGMKLCLHDRDWLAGRDIVDNIVSSIEGSRKTVLVVSNAYACSNWCQLELTMAQHQLFAEDKNNLILILKEDIIDELVTPRLALQMKTNTYIAWDDSEMGEKVFWEKLVREIKKPTGSLKYSLEI